MYLVLPQLQNLRSQSSVESGAVLCPQLLGHVYHRSVSLHGVAVREELLAVNEVSELVILGIKSRPAPVDKDGHLADPYGDGAILPAVVLSLLESEADLSAHVIEVAETVVGGMDQLSGTREHGGGLGLGVGGSGGILGGHVRMGVGRGRLRVGGIFRRCGGIGGGDQGGILRCDLLGHGHVLGVGLGGLFFVAGGQPRRQSQQKYSDQ